MNLKYISDDSIFILYQPDNLNFMLLEVLSVCRYICYHGDHIIVSYEACDEDGEAATKAKANKIEMQLQGMYQLCPTGRSLCHTWCKGEAMQL
jgi:hypothetical protein